MCHFKEGEGMKITSVERVCRSETSFAFTGGLMENLRLQAQIAIDKFLKSVGQNARGEFRIRIEFRPDSNPRV